MIGTGTCWVPDHVSLKDEYSRRPLDESYDLFNGRLAAFAAA